MTYKVTLNNFGKNYVGQGDTILKALSDINAGKLAGRSLMTVQHGKVNKERVLPSLVAKRAFNGSGMVQEAALKSISLLFQGI